MIETLVVLGQIVGILFLLYYGVVVIIATFYILDKRDDLDSIMKEWIYEPSRNDREAKIKDNYLNYKSIRFLVKFLAVISLPFIIIKRFF